LAVFDSRVSAETEKLVIAAVDKPEPDHTPKCPVVDDEALLSLEELEQFCTDNSTILF